MSGFEPAPQSPQEPQRAEWPELDDTLAEGPAAADVPADAKPWLADQRFLHGLLRTLHTADAAAREGRIAGILERIDHEGSPSPRRRWLLVASAALVLASFGTWFALPASLPTAEAAVQRAAHELARDVDRRFRLVATATNDAGAELRHHEFALVVRPGSRFRVDGKLAFGGLPVVEIRAGCDGEQLWLTSTNGLFRHAGPLSDRERLQQRLGEVLDLGYLDVHELVRQLPDDFELRVVGRQTDAAGRSQLRIEATHRSANSRVHVRSAQLECDEETGMVTRLVVDVEARPGARRLELLYLGEEPPGLVDYRRPW